MDLKEVEQRAENRIKTFLKENWFKIICFLAINIFVFCMWIEFRDAVHTFLNRKQEVTVVQPPNNAPININAAGQPTAKAPEIYVNLQTQGTTESVAQVREKASPKTDPDFVIEEKPQTYTMSFNGGKPISFTPDFKETSKLEKGQFFYKSQYSTNVNVEVPQPEWDIGIGKSTKGGYAVTGAVRIAHTPFNVWGYASSNDTAYGVKFVQYGIK